jgi:S-DNA-T family DNA segregation ATPase FtsK/SpoIIIE
MSHKNKNKNKNFNNQKNNNFNQSSFKKVPKLNLKEETKKTIAGIACFGVALILILSFFQLAGPLGQNIYKTFLYLFGWVYFFSPVIFIIAGALFLGSIKQNIYAATVFGLLLFSFSILGISDLITPDSTGFFGKIFGSLEKVLGFWGSMAFYIVAGIIGLVIAFEVSLDFFKKKDEEEEGGEEDFQPVKKVEIKSNGKILKEETPAKEEPKIKEPEADKTMKMEKIKKDRTISNWTFPPLDLLESDSGKPTSGDIKANVNIIKRTLANFGIDVEMDEVSVGPTVTRYTLKPAEGMKLSKIVNLQNDLSLALAAHPIRIEAPIPGKSLVGIEVPNKTKTSVRMKNLLSLDKFWESTLLNIPLGRDVSGEQIFTDIAKMPHMLVAGSTGSGKSVSVHSILISLLYKNTPETLRLLLIDPKRVELTAYNGIPHLISDVIIQPKKTIMALRWAVMEMDKRYNELLEAKVRDIGSYNQKSLKDKKPLMPYIVVVIDELADLMAAYGREVEGSIVRLAQMARATGIHLIVSTQRPSVEVITGLIKANITTRVALQVASQIDSRTILDTSGAEKLLGQGDMLYLAAETSKPKRIQGVFVSESEVAKVTKFIIENNEEYSADNAEKENFEEELQQSFTIAQSGGGMENFGAFDDGGDELYPEAYKIVVESQKASASFLQRRLRVGYARAARLLDLLEDKGVIGPGDGAKPRDVLMKSTNPMDQPIEEIEEKTVRVPGDIKGIEVEEVVDEEENTKTETEEESEENEEE